MRQAHYGRVFHVKENFPAIPCQAPERHKELGMWLKPKDRPDSERECWQCFHDWERRLPWIRPQLDQMSFEDDEALLELVKFPAELRKKKRWSITYSNAFSHLGPDYQDYIVEVFAVVVQEVDDPEKLADYPYLRLNIKDHPNYLAPVVRHRVCYEPSLNDCQAYLEIIRSGSKYDVNIRGLGRDYIRRRDLDPLLQAREWWFDVNSPDSFEVKLSLDSLPPKLRAKLDRFIRAAESLGADKKNNKTFSILKLCDKYESRRGDQSRDTYYKLISAIKDACGEQISEAVVKMIRNAYNSAKMKADSTDEKIIKVDGEAPPPLQNGQQ